MKLGRIYDGRYHYRIYDLEQDTWVDEWRESDTVIHTVHPHSESALITIRKEDAMLHKQMSEEFIFWLEENDLAPWDL